MGCKYQISQCGHPTSTKTKKVGGFSGGIFSMHMGVGVRGSVLGQYFGGGGFRKCMDGPMLRKSSS